MICLTLYLYCEHDQTFKMIQRKSIFLKIRPISRHKEALINDNVQKSIKIRTFTNCDELVFPDGGPTPLAPIAIKLNSNDNFEIVEMIHRLSRLGRVSYFYRSFHVPLQGSTSHFLSMYRSKEVPHIFISLYR